MSELKLKKEEKPEGSLWIGLIILVIFIVFVSGLKAFLPYKEPSPPPAIAKKETPPPPAPNFSKISEDFSKVRVDFYKSELYPNLAEKVNKDVSSLIDEIKKVTDEKNNTKQKIEKNYYLMNLYYYASATSSEKLAKITNADNSIEFANNVSNLVKDVEEKAKLTPKKRKTKKDKMSAEKQAVENENFREIIRWIKKEDIKEKVSFYQALDLSIKKLSGDDVKENEFIDTLKAIPRKFMRKGKLYNHPTLKEAIKKYKKEDIKNLGKNYPKGL